MLILRLILLLLQILGDTIVVDGGAWMYHPRLISRETLNTITAEQRKRNTSSSSTNPTSGPKAKL